MVGQKWVMSAIYVYLGNYPSSHCQSIHIKTDKSIQRNRLNRGLQITLFSECNGLYNALLPN